MNGYFLAYIVTLGLGASFTFAYGWKLVANHRPEPAFILHSADQLVFTRFQVQKVERTVQDGKPARFVTIVEDVGEDSGRIVVELTQVWESINPPAMATAPRWESISVSREGHSGCYEFLFSHGTLEKICRNGMTIPSITQAARQMAGNALQATRYLGSKG